MSAWALTLSRCFWLGRYTGANCVSRIGIVRAPAGEVDSEIGSYASGSVLTQVYEAQVTNRSKPVLNLF